MTAPDRHPRDGKEAALLASYNRLPSPSWQAAFIKALERLGDGQPAEDCGTEMFIELGWAPAAARQKARNLLRDHLDDNGCAGRFDLIAAQKPRPARSGRGLGRI